MSIPNVFSLASIGSDVDKTYEVQFSMSPEPPEQEEETITAEGKTQCKSKQSPAR